MGSNQVAGEMKSVTVMHAYRRQTGRGMVTAGQGIRKMRRLLRPSVKMLRMIRP